MKTWFFLLVCCLFQTNMFGQNVIEELQNARSEANYHIKALKESALLVRLKTRDRSIEAYRAAGANELAKRIEQEQFAENQRTMVLFKELFNFCPVYFFYANQTKQVLAGNITGNLLNDALQPDTSIHLLTDNFYIAEIDALFETLPDEDEEFTDDVQTAGKNVSTNGKHADTTLQNVIVIKDRNLVQLKRPFPFYVRASFDRFLPSKVEKFNNKLQRFYTEAGQ